jgi:hypothetical protein
LRFYENQIGYQPIENIGFMRFLRNSKTANNSGVYQRSISEDNAKNSEASRCYPSWRPHPVCVAMQSVMSAAFRTVASTWAHGANSTMPLWPF